MNKNEESADKDEPKYIKIRYSSWETGWAEDLGNNLARISNNPLAGDISHGDVVEVSEDEDYFPEIVRLVERKFPWKAMIKYSKENHFPMMSSAAQIAGLSMEGGIGPKDGKEGMCMLACKRETDSTELLAKLGLINEVKCEVYQLPDDLDWEAREQEN